MLSVRLINPNNLASPLVLKVGKGSVKLSLSLSLSRWHSNIQVPGPCSFSYPSSFGSFLFFCVGDYALLVEKKILFIISFCTLKDNRGVLDFMSAEIKPLRADHDNTCDATSSHLYISYHQPFPLSFIPFYTLYFIFIDATGNV